VACLFQEDLRAEPFWMLVGCQLVNRARWSVARGVMDRLRLRWGSPEDLSRAALGDIAHVVRPLGFQRSRAGSLRRFAGAWLMDEPGTREDVLAMPGCGGYAADSWAIFVEGRRDVAPTDSRLVWYLTDGREGRSG
jgi:endonuclease III